MDDAAARTDELVAAGADLIASPLKTPWRKVNSRLHAPVDLAVTLPQELDSLDERSVRDEFTRP